MLPDFQLLQRNYLLRISQAMSSQLDLRALLKIIMENAVELLAGQAGLVVLRQQSNNLAPAVSIGLPREVVPKFAPLWEDIPADAENIPDVARRLVLAARATHMPLKQVVALPLNAEGENRGYIFIFRARGAASFTEKDRAVLRTFANHAAIAVHNAHLYRQVLNEREQLNAIIENSGDGVMMINPFRIIKSWNSALTKLTGLTAEDAIGNPCYAVLNLKTPQGVSVCHTRCPILHPPANRQLSAEGFYARKDGVRVAFADLYSPMYDEDDQVIQYIANMRDVTRQREADDLRETLLAVISHELKTPVSIIKGYAGTLGREDAHWDKKTLDEGLTVIEEEADKLNALITNFLEASRLQAGSLRLHISEVYLPEMIERTINTLRSTTEDHLFSVDFPEDFPVIRGDYERLEQVITNLVSNAIKYSPKGGRIRIGGTFAAANVRFFVADDGIGIPAAEQELIFERFHRVDNGLTRQAPGTGLGLFLVKAVVVAHSGSVWVESDVGVGSTFWVELPR